MSELNASGSHREKPFSIVQLTLRIKAQLELNFPRVWVVGEISNFRPANSGHWYFSLKDDEAQIRATMWRSSAGRVAFKPKDGMEVLVQGTLNVYPPRGEYALIVETMEPLGQGRLRAEFEALKKRLMAEGLFDTGSKKSLPLLPQKIGLITSPTGAAVRDMIRVLTSRFPGLHIQVFPARVQGDGAGAELAEAVAWMDAHANCDLLIIGRGGGSEEDLWAFNDEGLARAIFACQTPIISAVGHEIDFTISDYVADVRAATPSNAAELAVRTQAEYMQMVQIQRRQLERHVQALIHKIRSLLNFSENSPAFIRVRSRFYDAASRVSDLENRLHRTIEKRLSKLEQLLARAHGRFQIGRLQNNGLRLRQKLEVLCGRLEERSRHRLEGQQQRLALLASRLEDLSPLRILARGFGVVYNARQQVVRSPDQVRFGEVLRIRVEKGELHARVVEVENPIQPDLFE
ncbi:MAG: exodeoxyribonuclease VII large subunit [Acidobacteria bacterium]|nr:exodeoxyribonuclease VII large subunit [Acidobacteriota bacterium]MCB9398245.1 exodeoxyribonuclease VII large subunit [Acidobacteriota bacterium]